MMGFRPVARHRSREVELYRQGSMNVIVNAQPADVPRTVQPVERPIISAFAVRVRDADPAFRRALDLGAWADPGAGAARWSSTYRRSTASATASSTSSTATTSSRSTTSTFVPIPNVDPHPPAIAGLHFFGIVQYIGADRTPDWVEFYSRIFGFTPLPNRVRFGIMPKGLLLQSPCRNFYLQLIEPDAAASIAHGRSTCSASVSARLTFRARRPQLGKRGVEFVESASVHTGDRGALTKPYLGSVMFELVHSESGRAAAQE